MNQTLKIFTNEVYKGWSPEDLETFLGGSEECVVLLADALQRKDFDVSVYHTQKHSEADENSTKTIKGVKYISRQKAKCNSNYIFITFKDPSPWINGAQAIKKIHWSSDIERPWGINRQGISHVNNVDFFINITSYHQYKNTFVPPQKQYIIPHGIDTASLNKNKVDKVKNTLLYCSSPDRGLYQLLLDWKKIKEKQPELKLKVSYGWNNFHFQNLDIRRFKFDVEKLLKQDDVEFLGTLTKNQMEKEYWKAEYWILPLHNPDSELFCLNAIKSKYCGCKHIVNKLGGLKDTVWEYIPYRNFVFNNLDIVQDSGIANVATWDEIVERYWMPILDLKTSSIG